MFGSEKVNDTLFRIEERRWEKIKKLLESRPGIQLDPLIVPLLMRLNEVEGLVTRWSCSGHPEKEGDEGSGYIMMILRDAEREQNVRLLEAICDKAYRNGKQLNLPSRFFFELSRTYRLAEFLTGMETAVVYNLGFCYQDAREQAHIIQMLNYAIEETIDPVSYFKSTVAF